MTTGEALSFVAANVRGETCLRNGEREGRRKGECAQDGSKTYRVSNTTQKKCFKRNYQIN